jgi:hypothetical protein
MAESLGMRKVCFDSFSGAAADLKGRHRTSENVLSALARDPRISTWDLCEHQWLRRCIDDLKHRGLIVSVDDEPYPWCRYRIVGAA